MGGTPVLPTCTGTGTGVVCIFNRVTVYAQPDPFPPSKLSVFVFQDDFPLNGEQDGGGGTGAVNTNNEAGLGQFNIILFDDAGGTGDATGQMTYDMFNQPLVNSLAGTIDPLSGKDACPVSINSRAGVADPTQTGITGTIVTCPQFESDGVTPSPLAGQAVRFELRASQDRKSTRLNSSHQIISDSVFFFKQKKAWRGALFPAASSELPETA